MPGVSMILHVRAATNRQTRAIADRAFAVMELPRPARVYYQVDERFPGIIEAAAVVGLPADIRSLGDALVYMLWHVRHLADPWNVACDPNFSPPVTMVYGFASPGSAIAIPAITAAQFTVASTQSDEGGRGSQ